MRFSCGEADIDPVPVSVNSSNPIYSYRASDELGNDAWGSLVTQTVVMTDIALTPTFKAWEGEYTSVTALPVPGAWRSAKSVIVNARKWDVPVINADGTARGKTAVEKEIKAKKDSAKDVLTPYEKACKLFETAQLYSTQNGINASYIINPV